MGAHVLRFLSLFSVLTLASCIPNITFEEPPSQPPLKKISITKWNGRVDEIFATLQDGVRLTSVVDISFFDGLDYRMSLDAAKQRLGQPKSQRTQADMRLPVYLYSVPKGEIGFMSVPTSGGSPRQPQVWAYPTIQAPALVILDASLRAQLLPRLSNQPIRVHLLRDVGFGGVTLSMTSNRVDYLILGPRDGD